MKTVAGRESNATGTGTARRTNRGVALRAPGHGMPAVAERISSGDIGAAVGAAPPANNTGLPDRLKTGIETLSGFAMDDVQVHYNSSKPATLQARAYTQGTNIHIAPGQEQHLPHEAWHVVQQKQGRVKPTLQAKGVAINDDDGLEREADKMALQAAGAAGPVEHRPATARRVGVSQMKWEEEKYHVDNKPRLLHVDYRDVAWGGAQNRDQAAKKTRAFLFETITIPDHLAPLIERLDQPDSLMDTGLTVVMNSAYTPAAAKKVKKGDQPGRPLGDVTKSLDAAWAKATHGWQGFPLQIVTAAWERRINNPNDDKPSLEGVQGSVPYSTLRRIAATNPGATKIDAALRANHDHVWRKMGDDDMPFVDPNPAELHGEVKKLETVEQDGSIQKKNTFVTFGYNLVTANTKYPVTDILELIYKIEMALRDEIHKCKAPIYPSEPTTFYRPAGPGTMDPTWRSMEEQKVGGSGQQLEGAKLVRAGKPDLQQFAFHSISVETAAGRRNDSLIALLTRWYEDGDITAVDAGAVEAEINKMDQSALRHDEYLKKVVGNLGGKLANETHVKIATLVRERREFAAGAVEKKMKQAIYGKYAARFNLSEQPVGLIAPHMLRMESGFVTNLLIDRPGLPDDKERGKDRAKDKIVDAMKWRRLRLEEERVKRPPPPAAIG